MSQRSLHKCDCILTVLHGGNFFKGKELLQFQLKYLRAFKLIEVINLIFLTDFTDWLLQTVLPKIYTLSIVNSEHAPKMDKTSYLFEKL